MDNGVFPTTPAKSDNSRSTTPPVPHGTTPLSHQVAGHVFGRENGRTKNKMGFLQCDDGAILKPIQGPGKGQRELEFYQRLFQKDCQDPVLVKLRQFMPEYIGVWTTDEHPGVTYLKLSDVTHSFDKPSIMDAKIGPITYDGEADEAKRQRELAKFPKLEQVKFQLVGMKVYDLSSDAYSTIERTFLRALDEETISTEGLATYFRPAGKHQHRLIAAFLRRLTAVEAWFVEQHELQFIASSLLFVYDGSKLPSHVDDTLQLHSDAREISSNGGRDVDRSPPTKRSKAAKVFSGSDADPEFDSLVSLHMIDFTHVFPLSGDDTESDDNYLVGLRSLMTYLRKLLEVHSNGV